MHVMSVRQSLPYPYRSVTLKLNANMPGSTIIYMSVIPGTCTYDEHTTVGNGQINHSGRLTLRPVYLDTVLIQMNKTQTS